MVLRTSGSSALADVDHQTRPNTFGDGKKDSKAANSAAAKDQLRNNEDLASGPASTVAASDNANQNEIDESRAAENEPDFVNSVAGRDEKDKGKGSFAKRRAPLLIILGMIFGGGGLMFGMQSLMPFSLLEQLRTKFDSLSTVTELRSNVFMKYQLDETEINNPIARKYFGLGGQTFKVTNKQKSKLSAQGIDVEEIEVDGKTKRVMVFDDGSGSRKLVAADTATADLIKSKMSGATEITTKGGTKYKVDIGDTVDFNTKFDSSSDFRNGYVKSSRTWRGAVGAWFDSVTARFLQSNNLTRNRFQNFQERVRSEANGNTRAMANDLIDKSAAELSGTSKEKSYSTKTDDGTEHKVEVEYDEDGKKPRYYYNKTNENTGLPEKVYIDEKTVTIADTPVSVKMKTNAEIKEKLNSIKNSVGGKVTGAASTVANLACTVFDFMGAVNLLVAAQEAMQIVQVTSSYLEAIDKAKTEYSSDSPINDIANNLTMPMDTKVIVSATTMDDEQIRNLDLLDSNSNNDDAYKTASNTVREDVSAMQSSAIASLYTGQRIDANDPVVASFIPGSTYPDIMSKLGVSIASFTDCAFAKIAAAAIGGLTDFASIAICVFTAGIGCVASALGEAAVSVGGSIAMAGAFSLAAKYLTPTLVTWFARDLISDIAGEELGTAIVAGMNVYSGTNHLTGGGTPATRESYALFMNEKAKVDAEYARYQRETLSPFDISSQYTFLGSLAKQIITFGTTTNSPTNIVSTMSSMVSNSVASLLPTATAIDVSKDLIPQSEYEQICPALASINVVGDAFCNPYIASDLSTIEESPEAIVDKVSSSLTSDGEIAENSDLAKFIKYCSGRSSAFGVADTNIANSFSVGDVNSSNEIFNIGANAVIGAIPVIGDSLDLFTNKEKLKNTGWITGESCVIGNTLITGNGIEAISWDDMRYYQRYVEDQRLFESINSGYTSTVTAFLEKQEKENPVDNSYEGIMARKTGLPKETVVAVLDYIEYSTYIANYKPAERYYFANSMETIYKVSIKQQNGYSIYTPVRYIIYDELRSRTVNMA